MASVAKREWTYKGVKKSGWEVRYKEGGKHRSKTFKLKKEADAFRQKVEREVNDGTHIPSTEAKTVSDVCEMFVRDVESRVADGRIGRARQNDIRIAVDNHIVPKLGHVLIKDLSWPDVEGFYEDRRRFGFFGANAQEVCRYSEGHRRFRIQARSH